MRICITFECEMTSALVKNEIVGLHEFLEYSLGRKVLDYSLGALTKPGDNYGSIIQALTVIVTPKQDNINCDVCISYEILWD